MRAFLLALIVIIAASSAHGASRVNAFLLGNDLYPECQDRSPTCMSYVIGVADTVEMVAQHLTNVCRPADVTAEQIFDVLMSWLEENPAERHRPAAKLAGLAFAEAWPCSK